MAKNQKLLKTGCNNVVRATLFNIVNKIVRHNNTVQYIVDNQPVAPTTSLHPVFNNLLQLKIFRRVHNNSVNTFYIH